MGRLSGNASQKGAASGPRAKQDRSPGEVTLAAYDARWPTDYRLEAARIGDAVGSGLVLHHIGSTSVPGMRAKPIIDMLGEVLALAEVEAMTAPLEQLGYEAMGAFGIEGRRYFRRMIDGKRTHHLHIFETGSAGAARHLALRDYLRTKPREAQAYIVEKKRAVLTADYQSAKSPFVASLEARALAWAARPRVVSSINDASGTRCVDIQAVPGGFAWVECRRDPEDNHGWRLTGTGERGFDTVAAARAAAAQHCAWVEP